MSARGAKTENMGGATLGDAGKATATAVLAETARLIDDLYRAATTPDREPRWVALLNRLASSTRMGPYNLMLADVQRPGARFVAFPEDWRVMGRSVRPAAIPIIVLWPFAPVRCAYDLADTTGSAVDDEALGRMFGAPLPVRPGVVQKLAARAAREDDIEVRFVRLGSQLAGDARATGAPTASRGKRQAARWVVRIATHLEGGAQLTTLIHELAHVYLGHLGANGQKWPERLLGRADARELEAEAVSFLVGRRFGLATGSADYLRGHLRDDTIAHVSFAAIARAAGRIEHHAR